MARNLIESRQIGFTLRQYHHMMSYGQRMIADALNRKVLVETVALTMICALDTYWTLILVRIGIGRETNPILEWSIDHSNWAFLTIKLSSFLVPIVILEMLRPKHPGLILKAMRFGTLGYVAVYLIGSLRVHGIL